MAIFAGRLLAGEPCTIFGDGNQTRDFVYVDDVVDAFVRAADRGSGLLANIGTGVETSVNDLYASMAGPPASTRPPVHAPARTGRAGPLVARPRPGRALPRLEAVDRARRRHRRPSSTGSASSRADIGLPGGWGGRSGGCRPAFQGGHDIGQIDAALGDRHDHGKGLIVLGVDDDTGGFQERGRPD